MQTIQARILDKGQTVFVQRDACPAVDPYTSSSAEFIFCRAGEHRCKHHVDADEHECMCGHERRADELAGKPVEIATTPTGPKEKGTVKKTNPDGTLTVEPQSKPGTTITVKPTARVAQLRKRLVATLAASNLPFGKQVAYAEALYETRGRGDEDFIKVAHEAIAEMRSRAGV